MIRSITFSDHLTIGHEAIDSQHQEWIEVANQLLRIDDPVEDCEAFSAALLHLIRYTRHHFATEEGLMEQWAYPRVEAQRQAHARILADLSASLDEDRSSCEVAQKIHEMLERWIIEHLLQEDLLLRDFLAQRPGDAAEA